MTKVILTQEDINSECGFEAHHKSFPHTTDAEMIKQLPNNLAGQATFLVKVDTTELDDPSHPDPGCPEGWSWVSAPLDSW